MTSILAGLQPDISGSLGPDGFQRFKFERKKRKRAVDKKKSGYIYTDKKFVSHHFEKHYENEEPYH